MIESYSLRGVMAPTSNAYVNHTEMFKVEPVYYGCLGTNCKCSDLSRCPDFPGQLIR